jgi:hypothetical protein
MMRAKFIVNHVNVNKNDEGQTTSENLTMNAVCKSTAYPADGTDEDNTFSLWSPFGELKLTITNPNLFGKLIVGDKYYLDFLKASA